MTELVINESNCDYDLSFTAITEFGVDKHTPRTDPLLIEAVRTLGPAAGTPNSNLRIVEVPWPRWHIIEHDGFERVAEGHSDEIRREAAKFLAWRENRI